MKCPRCKEITLLIADKQGVEIDYCPECRGVWLDRGELDKIIEKSGAIETSSKYSESRDASSDNNKYDEHEKHNQGYSNNDQHKKKKGGFLGDILDF